MTGCEIYAHSYMLSQRNNKCRDYIFNAFTNLGELNSKVNIGKEEEKLSQIQKLANAIKVYLDQCTDCPFMKYGNLNKLEQS